MLLARLIPLGQPAPFSASAFPDSVYAYTATPHITFNSYPVTVTPSGGVAPYTHSWTPTVAPIKANDPTSGTTDFQYTGHGIASYDTVNFIDKVTDAVGHVVYVAVDVFMQSGGSPI